MCVRGGLLERGEDAGLLNGKECNELQGGSAERWKNLLIFPFWTFINVLMALTVHSSRVFSLYSCIIVLMFIISQVKVVQIYKFSL